MDLKRSLIIAAILSVIVLGSWEMYWRSQGYYPNLDDNKDSWAVERAKLKGASNLDVVVIGASRILFDFQKDEWHQATGKAPIQLASVGSSPLPTFRDIVRNTDFAGTVIVGVTPGLFFSTTSPKAGPMSRPQSKVDHYFDRTYAERINYQLSIPLQLSFVFMSATFNKWDDDIDLKALLLRIRIANRTGEKTETPFANFYDAEVDRNITMSIKTSTDTTFANSIKEVWKAGLVNPRTPQKEETMKYFLEDLEKFRSKGGNVILVRCPSTEEIRDHENANLPRTKFWDDLVVQAKVPAYHFEDYEQLRHFGCPEMSHLSAEDARMFTVELARILIADKAIKINI